MTTVSYVCWKSITLSHYLQNNYVGIFKSTEHNSQAYNKENKLIHETRYGNALFTMMPANKKTDVFL